MIGWEIITYLEGSAPEKHLLQPVDKEFRERIGHSLFLWSTSRKNVKTRPIFHENMAVFWHFLAMNGKLWVQNIVFYSYLVPEMIWWKVHENRMLGSAKTKLPPLTLTSWVKDATPLLRQICSNCALSWQKWCFPFVWQNVIICHDLMI